MVSDFMEGIAAASKADAAAPAAPPASLEPQPGCTRAVMFASTNGRAPLGTRAMLGVLTPLIKRHLGKPSPIMPLPPGVHPDRNNISRLLFAYGDRAQTAAVLAACKAHNITLNSLLHAAQLFAMAPYMLRHCTDRGGKGKPAQFTIDMTYPINLRGRSPAVEPKGHLGVYLLLAFYDAEVSEATTFWSLAQWVHKEVSDAVSPTGLPKTGAVTQKLFNLMLDVVPRMGGATGGAGSSNIGRYGYTSSVDLGPDGGVKLELRSLFLG